MLGDGTLAKYRKKAEQVHSASIDVRVLQKLSIRCYTGGAVFNIPAHMASLKTGVQNRTTFEASSAYHLAKVN
jgi:hypothetical protein